MKFLTAAILPLALLGAGCDIRVNDGGISSVGIMEGRAEDVWTRTYTLAANGTLEIVGKNGEISVEGGAGPQVEVRAEREVRAGSDEAARELLGRIQMREEVAPDRVRVSSDGEDGGGFGRSARVRYEVTVPAGLTLTFRTDNGGVRLQNVSGRITATTTNGGINGEDLAGSLTAETVNGGVRVDIASIAGDVRVATTNGGIRLTIPRDARATLEASVVNGGINIDSGFGVQEPEGRNQKVNAPINGGGPVLAATSVNGGIRIRARGADGD